MKYILKEEPEKNFFDFLSYKNKKIKKPENKYQEVKKQKNKKQKELNN